jgi:hypothetical protein
LPKLKGDFRGLHPKGGGEGLLLKELRFVSWLAGW